MRWARVLTWLLVGVAWGLAGAPLPANAQGDPGAPQIALQQVLSGLSKPIDITHAGDGSNRLFIAQQNGIVRIYNLNTNQLLVTPFLNISGLITPGDPVGDFEGLLGIAFHSNYGTNGRFFLSYVNTSKVQTLARFTVSAGDANIANPAPDAILLTIDYPAATFPHYGGQIQFGPDGYLYMSTGDGGETGGLPVNLQNAQDLSLLLGKVLRLDVDNGNPYAIPLTNPFVGILNARGEIWARGMRNPWRFSFDRMTGELFLTDVGDSAREEVDVQPAASPGGENYGWSRMEGSLCFSPATNCNDGTLTLPTFEYAHTQDSCGGSISGGYRYRGNTYPQLKALYIFSDFCRHDVRGAFQLSDGSWKQMLLLNLADAFPPSGFNVVGFGEDEAGEVYLGGFFEGRVFRITAQANPVPVLVLLAPDNALAGSGPLTLVVTGSNFKVNSVVQWNGSDRTTLFVSDTELHASLSAGDVANAGPVGVTVFTPAGGTSNALPFTVTPVSKLTVNSTNPGSGVQISVSPADINGQASGSTPFSRVYNQGTSVMLTAPPTAGGNTFSSWSGCDSVAGTTCTVAMNTDRTVTASYATPTHTLTVNSTNPGSGVQISVSPADINGQGSGSTPFSRVYNQGSNVTLTAPATAGGNTFSSWSGCDSVAGTTCTVAMNTDRTVTANYVTPTRTLTVNSTNPSSGVSITVSPADFNGQGSGITPFSRTYNQGTSVTLTAPSTAGGNNFSSWSGCDSVAGTTCTVAMNTDRTVTANYVTPPRTLTVNSTNPSSGVSITVSPADLNGQGSGPTSFSRLYNQGASVMLTAPSSAGAGRGNAFSSWSGCDLVAGTTCMVAMNTDRTVTANYGTGTPSLRTLTVNSTNPSSGVSVTLSPADTNGQGNGVTPFSRVYNQGTGIMLTAPSTVGGNNFSSWSGCDSASGTICTVTMNADRTVTANYGTGTPPRTLTVNSTNPSSGVSITVGPADVNGQASASTPFSRTYNQGTSVMLTAPSSAGAGRGNAFSSWSGCDLVAGTVCTVTMNADRTVTANYGTGTPSVRTLTVNSTNPSSGVSITVSPADSNGQGSGSTSFSRVYNQGASVTLTAPSTAGGNNFSSWSGCDLVAGTTCTVALNTDRIVTANYGAGTPPRR